jgi:tetratricopeptide (TPR) repeat protein
MKKLVPSFLLLLLPFFLHAQTNEVDSLKQLLQTGTSDTQRVMRLNQLSKVFFLSHSDTALILAQQALALSKKAGFKKGEAMSLNRIANVFTFTGNYPKSLEFHLEALKKAEDINDGILIGIILGNIGSDYAYQGNDHAAIDYSIKSLRMVKRLKDTVQVIAMLGNIGDSYLSLGILDSAKLYTNQAYDLSIKIKNPFSMVVILANLGDIYYKLGQDAVAIANYNLALPYALEDDDKDGSSGIYLGKAKVFLRENSPDSALHYAKLSLTLAKEGRIISRVMDASNFLTDFYTSKNNTDSTLFYLKATVAAKDSLFNAEKARQIESLTFDESMRQLKINEEKEAVAEERHRNIQYAVIGVGVLSFLILFLVYSRTIIANEKAIRFMGILALLLVFELLNLFLHPYIGSLTHETPILQLLIAVALASILIPLHHKLQHLLTHQMVIKNKRLRLAAAERTVAKLKEDKDLIEDRS